VLTPFKHYEDHIAPVGPVSAFFADDEMAALVLNTARRLTRKNGRVSREQMTEIRTVFAGMSNKCFKILATHHPLGEPAGGLGLELVHRSRPTLLAIAEAGVNVLLSGHHHRASSGAIFIGAERRHSIMVAHAGTAVSTRTRGSEGNSYNLVRLEPDIVTVAIMAWGPGSAFREARVSRYLRVANVWEPG